MESITPRSTQSTGTNYCRSCKRGPSREDRGLNIHGTTRESILFVYENFFLTQFY